MERSRSLSVRHLLIALVLGSLVHPAHAQWGGGDGAQAGATAYCAARAAGNDDRQASRAAANAMANSMTGSFTSNIATIITGGRAMRDSIKYLIQQQCPQYLGGEPAPTPVAPKPTDAAAYSRWCEDNPWLKECGGQDSNKIQSVYGKEHQPSLARPTKDSQARPSAAAESKANAICLKAVDYSGCMKYQLSK
jgi:hypothetical protein